MNKYVLVDLDDNSIRHFKTNQDVINLAKFMYDNDSATKDNFDFYDGKFDETFDQALEILQFNNFELAEIL